MSKNNGLQLKTFLLFCRKNKKKFMSTKVNFFYLAGFSTYVFLKKEIKLVK